MRKWVSVLLVLVLVLGMTAAAGAEEIYYLNFKPEIAEVYASIAQAYEEATGVAVKVETASAAFLLNR